MGKSILTFYSFLTVLFFFFQISFLELYLGDAYYAIQFFILVLLITYSSGFNSNYLMVFFIVVSFLSIICNDVPAFFQPYKRLGSFILGVGLVGPLFYNSTLFSFRFSLIKMLNNTILSMVTLSFIGIVFGLPYMIGRGGFVGLFKHSMVLGPMAAISVLVALNKAYVSDNSLKYYFFLSLATIAFITCIAAGSRSALLGGIAGVIFFYFKLYQGNSTRFIGTILIIVFLGIFSFPIWKSYTERLISKVEYGNSQGNSFISRVNLWQSRIYEFNSSPIIGVGFASVNTKFSSKVDKLNGNIEPGSSWLAILAMTGLLGFITIITITYRYVFFVFSDRIHSVNSSLYGGILVLFIVHMMAEGYVLSAGSGMFFYFWLTLGTIDIFERNSKINSEEVLKLYS